MERVGYAGTLTAYVIFGVITRAGETPKDQVEGDGMHATVYYSQAGCERLMLEQLARQSCPVM